MTNKTATLSNDVGDGVQAIVDRMVSTGKSLRVLEAGCGSRGHIQIGPHAYVVGIDISEEQLERNTHLHKKILGDIQTYPLEPASFDIIFCWDVLEHVRDPEKALQNFVRAISEGGMIVVGSPIVTSLKGLITKYTPHWFHVWVYRHVLGSKTAGKPGYGPFPTFLRYAMSPRAIQRFAKDHQLSVEHFIVYEDVQAELRAKHRVVDLVYSVFGPLLKTLSFGRIDPHTTDFIMVLRKPENGQRSAARV